MGGQNGEIPQNNHRPNERAKKVLRENPFAARGAQLATHLGVGEGGRLLRRSGLGYTGRGWHRGYLSLSVKKAVQRCKRFAAFALYARHPGWPQQKIRAKNQP
jgi:hypothetical protein